MRKKVTTRTKKAMRAQRECIFNMFILKNALHFTATTNSTDLAKVNKARDRFINNLSRCRDNEFECFGMWNLEVNSSGCIHYHFILNFPKLTRDEVRVKRDKPSYFIFDKRDLLDSEFGKKLFKKWEQQCNALGISVIRSACRLYDDFKSECSNQRFRICDSKPNMMDYFTKPDPVDYDVGACRYRVFNRNLMNQYKEASDQIHENHNPLHVQAS